MKIKDALDIIGEPSGYMVSFEWCGDGMLRSDHFPDKHAGESLIDTEEEAWILANKFAKKMRGRVCNLYIIGDDFVKVPHSKFIANRETE